LDGNIFNGILLQQRGKLKEEEFVKKIQEMAAVEEKQRIPVAQGLPWTTDEPEVKFVLLWIESHFFSLLHTTMFDCLCSKTH